MEFDLESAIYVAGLLFFGLAAAGAAVWLYLLCADNLLRWEKLPRNTYWGIAVAVPCLIWCIPNARPIMPDSMQAWCWPLVIICAILAYKFLDYLFSRALGGLLILTAYYFLEESFTRHSPAAPFLASCCFLFGSVGICFAGKPCWLRDLIRKCAVDRRWKMICAGCCCVCSLATLLPGFLHLARLVRG